jgi:hypothetical protein
VIRIHGQPPAQEYRLRQRKAGIEIEIFSAHWIGLRNIFGYLRTVFFPDYVQGPSRQFNLFSGLFRRSLFSLPNGLFSRSAEFALSLTSVHFAASAFAASAA